MMTMMVIVKNRVSRLPTTTALQARRTSLTDAMIIMIMMLNINMKMMMTIMKTMIMMMVMVKMMIIIIMMVMVRMMMMTALYFIKFRCVSSSFHLRFFAFFSFYSLLFIGKFP